MNTDENSPNPLSEQSSEQSSEQPSKPSALNREQKKKIYRSVFIMLGVIFLVVGLFVNKLTSPAILSAEMLKTKGVFLFENPRSFKDFSLIDYNNNKFTSGNLQGKWSLIFFGFTSCPDVCPTTMAMLNRFYKKQQQGEFFSDLQVIMVTVDPARDTADKLLSYVKYFNDDFIGVTGDFLGLHRFATQLNIPFAKVPGGGENYQVQHSGNVAIINPQGHYVGFFRSPLEFDNLNITYQSIRRSRK